jgi:hypothetical protein
VGGNNAVQPKPGAQRSPVERRAAPRELECAVGIRTLRPEVGGGRRFEQQRWGRRGGADAAEPATEVASQIEHSEVKSRGRFDENGVVHVGASRGAVST